MSTRKPLRWDVRTILLALLLAGCAFALGRDFGEVSAAPPAPVKDDAAARGAFLAAYPVFMHPRCMNCHPSGDAPLQGEDSRAHAQNVQRGSTGMGKYALKCSNCHQLQNLAGLNMPPGAPNWHLPPPQMKMVFEGKSAAALCRQLKDPKLNGGRTIAKAIDHLEKDPLVLWGWTPGEGRSAPPLPHAEFARKMQEWLQNGAACPE